MICLSGCSEPSNHEIDGVGSPCAEQGILPPLETRNTWKDQTIYLFTVPFINIESTYYIKRYNF